VLWWLKDATSGDKERVAKWQHKFSEFEIASGAPLEPMQEQRMFDREFLREDTSPRTAGLWASCRLVVGMHPDEATDAIVELSLQHGKPFAVVPCCVYWRLFPHRKTANGRQVRLPDELNEYLVGLAPEGKIRQAELGFPGRNVVLYTLPEGHDGHGHDRDRTTPLVTMAVTAEGGGGEGGGDRGRGGGGGGTGASAGN
jgi:hypothetical protein